MSNAIHCKYCLSLITNVTRSTRQFCDFSCNQKFKRARAKNEQWKHEHFDTASKFAQISTIAAQNIVRRIGLLSGAAAARAAIDAVLITQLNNSADDRINSDSTARDAIADCYPSYSGKLTPKPTKTH